MSDNQARGKIAPFALTIFVIAIDQLTKAMLVASVPLYGTKQVLGNFLRVVHVRNPAIAFSIGRNLPPDVQRITFLLVPLVVVGLLLYYYFATPDISQTQRWLLAAIMGGGLGNHVDRLARGGGVVDFIDFKFYGILGMQRWPTFNLADATVVVAGLLMLISIIAQEAKRGSEQKEA